MKKYLYFQSGTIDGTDATEEVIMVDADRVSHYEMKTATDLRVYFDTTVGQETTTGDADVHVDHSFVALDVTSGYHKEALEAIAGAIGSAAAINSPMVVVADVANSKFVSPYITSCTITVIDKS